MQYKVKIIKFFIQYIDIECLPWNDQIYNQRYGLQWKFMLLDFRILIRNLVVIIDITGLLLLIISNQCKISGNVNIQVYW